MEPLEGFAMTVFPDKFILVFVLKIILFGFQCAGIQKQMHEFTKTCCWPPVRQVDAAEP
jgi:hypothetical protein